MPTKTLPRPAIQRIPSMAEKRAVRKASRERFLRSRKATGRYTRQLLSVAAQVGKLVSGYAPDGVVEDVPGLMALLSRYAEFIAPWAEKVAQQMLDEVSQRDHAAWLALGREVGRGLREEIQTAPTGDAMRALLAEQVTLITSLPIEAAQRVHKLTTENISSGGRFKEIADMIYNTEKVTKSRARLIARTEVARTASILTQVRAEHVGSKGYIWRTASDSDVREIHKHLEGQYIPWNDPPVAAQKGIKAHAGQIWNCRCFSEPVLPDIIL